MDAIVMHPIGVVHSPFADPVGVPRQAAGATDVRGMIEIFPPFVAGLADVEGFSHLEVLFHLHRGVKAEWISYPPFDDRPHGVFSTRSPYRPNPIGLSVVRLVGRIDNVLHIAGVDMVDGSPVLDIKPYVPQLLPAEAVRIGWLDGGRAEAMNQGRSGGRPGRETPSHG